MGRLEALAARQEGGRRAHQDARQGERDRLGRPGGPARRGQGGRHQPLAQPRALGHVDRGAGRRRGLIGATLTPAARPGEAPRAAPVLTALRRPGRRDPGPRSSRPPPARRSSARPQPRRACPRRPRRRRRTRPRARSRPAAARRPRGRRSPAPAPPDSARISSHSALDQPPPPTGSRLWPRSHQTRISSGTFTTTQGRDDPDRQRLRAAGAGGEQRDEAPQREDHQGEGDQPKDDPRPRVAATIHEQRSARTHERTLATSRSIAADGRPHLAEWGVSCGSPCR